MGGEPYPDRDENGTFLRCFQCGTRNAYSIDVWHTNTEEARPADAGPAPDVKQAD